MCRYQEFIIYPGVTEDSGGKNFKIVDVHYCSCGYQKSDEVKTSLWGEKK